MAIPSRPGPVRPGQKPSAPAKAGPSKAVAAAAVAGLVLALGSLYFTMFRPAPPLKPATTATAQISRFLTPADQGWVSQKARECGGDVDRLNVQDQQRMHEIFKGGEYVALRQVAGELPK